MKQISQLETNAKALRKNLTHPERRLWYLLRNRQFSKYKFRRQYWIEHYILDFVCLEKRLVIEVDGGQHALNVDDDFKRTLFLEERGFTVLRFWNNEVLYNIQGVVEVLNCFLQARG